MPAFLQIRIRLDCILYIIIAVFLSDLDWCVETGRSCRKNIVTYVSLALCFFYLEKSQARTSLIAVAAIVLLWIVLRFYLAKKDKKITGPF